MTIQECLAKNIKYYRNKNNLTQSQLAEACKTSTNYIATIETGKKYPSPTTLEKIAKVFNIEALDLFQIHKEIHATNDRQSIEKIRNTLQTEISKLINSIVK